MLFQKRNRLARWGLAFALLLPVLSFAQSMDNHIEIILNDVSYDCSTGQATVSFHITNYDESGNWGSYHTVYNIDLGASRVVGRSLPAGDADVFFTGAYNPGDDIVCTAWGISNNGAPQVDFHTYVLAPVPSVPTISASASFPLCNGAYVTLTANSPDASYYVWSNGQTGNSITVNAAGTYTVHAVGTCGSSAESNPVIVTVASAPAAPVIGSSNGTLLCNGSSTTLSATSSGGTINWSNGATGTSISTSSPGTYYASESNGCGTSGNSNVITISVSNTPPSPAVNSSNGTSLCNGETTTLSTAPSAGGTISWSTGATGNSIIVSSPGNYYAYETNSCGTSGISNVVAITTGSVPSAPSISSSNGTLLCNGSSTVLTASGGGTISWNTGAVSSAIGVTSAGTYYAVATNNCGTSGASNSIVITASSTPSSPSVSSSGGPLLCNGAAATLTTSPSYGGTIYWNTGATGNSISVSAAGNYYAYESNGCGNGGNSNVVAFATSSTPSAPTVTPSGNQQLCNGASVTLSSNGSNVLWSNGATGNTITVSTAGSYYAIDRNSCGNSSASNTVSVTTIVCPTPSPGGSFLVCPGANKTLDAGSGYDTYQWSNGATTQTTSVGPGTYTVTVSKSGCFATSAAVSVGYYSVITPTITESGATTFCAGGNVNLSSSAGTAYAWNTGATGNNITVTTSGAYYVTVTDGNGCQATSSALTVNVHPLPTATVSGNTSVCLNATSPAITFNGSGATAPYTFSYRINGGGIQTVSTTSGNSVSVNVPTSSAGSFTYSLVSVQESSGTTCTNAASGSATVTVNALPTATITGTTTTCRNSASPSVVFTGNGGNAPYTFTYKINGGANQVISTSSGNSVSIAAPTNTTGSFVYSLVSVQEAGSCANSASVSATITVNELPSATIAGTASVCQGSASPLINFAGSNGIAPYSFTYRINGGSAQTITTTSGNSVTIPVPTTTAGDYVYTLVSVRESSGNTCSNTASGSVTIHVNALPTATISGDATLCRNASAPSITFTGNGGTAPFTFSYRINGGSLQTITTSTGNGVSVQVPTTTAGSFVYSLVSVQESGSTACSAVAIGTATVVINPLPAATISGSATVCQNSASPVITFTGSGGTVPYTFVYRINNGTDQTVTGSGNSASINAPTTSAGTYTYSLVSVQDASSTACSSGATGTVTIVVNNQPSKAIVTTTQTHLCNGETGVLKVTNYVSGYQYNWYKDGALIRTTNKDTIQVTLAGSYTVLPVSPEGCEAPAISDAINITTGTVTTPVITGSLKVCPGGKTFLTALNADGQPYDQWRWTGPPGNRTIVAEDSSFFAAAGQYRVRVITQGCADSASVAVTADDTEYPAGKLTIEPRAVSYGEKAIITADVIGAVNFKWDLNDRNKITTSTHVLEQQFYHSGDSIPIKVWATSARNCTTLFNSYVSVAPMIVDTLPDHSFTGSARDWNVFPIPFTDHLKVTAVLKRNETVRLDLFSGDGRWIRKWECKGNKGDNEFVLDYFENLLPNNIYILTGFYNGTKHSEKVIKQ